VPGFPVRASFDAHSLSSTGRRSPWQLNELRSTLNGELHLRTSDDLHLAETLKEFRHRRLVALAERLQHRRCDAPIAGPARARLESDTNSTARHNPHVSARQAIVHSATQRAIVQPSEPADGLFCRNDPTGWHYRGDCGTSQVNVCTGSLFVSSCTQRQLRAVPEGPFRQNGPTLAWVALWRTLAEVVRFSGLTEPGYRKLAQSDQD
jgi:hypothetical protein